MGVLTENDVQLVFTDTPGFHRPRTKLGEKMVKAVSDSLMHTRDIMSRLISECTGHTFGRAARRGKGSSRQV